MHVLPPPTSRDWKLYEERCGEEHVQWLRSLSADEASSLYESFHRFAASIKDPREGEGMERLERLRWNSLTPPGSSP